MSVVYKYELAMRRDEQTIRLPRQAKPLHVSVQGETLCLWCLVNPDYEVIPRVVRIAGTGHKLPDNPGDYVGTVHIESQMTVLVFHVFVER